MEAAMSCCDTTFEDDDDSWSAYCSEEMETIWGASIMGVLVLLPLGLLYANRCLKEDLPLQEGPMKMILATSITTDSCVWTAISESHVHVVINGSEKKMEGYDTISACTPAYVPLAPNIDCTRQYV